MDKKKDTSEYHVSPGEETTQPCQIKYSDVYHKHHW